MVKKCNAIHTYKVLTVVCIIVWKRACISLYDENIFSYYNVCNKKEKIAFCVLDINPLSIQPLSWSKYINIESSIPIENR